jgi:hypothetical protein
MARLPAFPVLLILLAGLGPARAADPAAEAGWIKDRNGCKISNPNPKPGETVTWSGACERGYAEGKGVLQFSLAGKPAARYEGTMHKGLISGSGSLRSPDGSLYEGDWVDGKPDGFGRYTDGAGNEYVGGWTAGQQDGPGTLRNKDGQTLAGTWRKGQYVGKE